MSLLLMGVQRDAHGLFAPPGYTRDVYSSYGGTDVRPFVGHTKGTTKAVVGSRRPCFPKGALPSTPSKVPPAKSGLRNQIFGGTNLPIRKKANIGLLFGAHTASVQHVPWKRIGPAVATLLFGSFQAWFPRNGHRTLDKQRNALLGNASPSFGPRGPKIRPLEESRSGPFTF